jgi:PKD repeat protein
MKNSLLSFVCLFAVMFQLQSATISTSKSNYTVGESIVVSYTGSTHAKDWIGIYPSTGSPGSGNSIDWFYCNSGTRSSGASPTQEGTRSFSTSLAAGNYIVFMCANDGYTVMAQVPITVVVDAFPIAAFEVSKNIIEPGETITFFDKSAKFPTSWSWTFEGGTPETSTLKNPVVTYSTPGMFDVTLVATNDLGSSTALIKSNYINVTNTPPSELELKLMQFNVWQEGTSATNGYTNIIEVIKCVNPDIVAFSEVRNYNGDWTSKVVASLAEAGHNYHRGYSTGDVSIISKYPITSASENLASAITVFQVDLNGTPILVAAAHLDYTHYACYLPRAYNCGGFAPYTGWGPIASGPVTDLSIISAQNLASKRDEQIKAFLDYVKEEERPIILMGDFNEPSHLDWTQNQADLFDHNGVVFEWPTTLTLKNSGFVDAYRKVYPNEVTNPGFTWPAVADGAGITSWAPLSDERDRIDYIFYKGEGVIATKASIVGPKASYVRNQPSTADNGFDVFECDSLPWPSDHKAVAATITIPIPSADNEPYLVANKTNFGTNEAITMRFNGSQTTNDWIGIFPGDAPIVSGNYLDWKYTSGSQTASATVIAKGSVTFNAGISNAGEYKAYLLANDRFTVIASFSFTVVSTVPPVSGFRSNQSSTFPGQKIHFYDESINTPTAWQWFFSGGNPSSSSLQNPVVSYSETGVYDVSLVTSNEYGESEMLTKVNYVSISEAPINMALQFDGIDDQLFTGTGLLRMWTVQAWIKGDGSWSDGNEAIFTNGWMNIPGWEQYPLVLKGGKPSTSTLTVPEPLDQNWNHVAVSYDGSLQKIYINGALIATGAAGIGGPCSPNFIGSYDSDSQGSQYFGGTLDEIAVFDHALSENTIAMWYDKPIIPQHPDYDKLVLYYPCDDEATLVTDIKNNYDGTLKRQYNSLDTPGGPVYVRNDNPDFSVLELEMEHLNTFALPAKFDAFPGAEAQLMKLKVNTVGHINSLTVNEITFDMSSCTDLADISTVRLYYLGKSLEEEYKTEIFGSGVVPASSITFTGEQVLLPGTNYFLVTYQVSDSAKVGNKLDINCTSVKTNNSSFVPVVKNSVNYPKGIQIIPQKANPQVLKVLQANVWHALKGLSQQKEGVKRMLGVIRASKADIVTLQETYGVGPTLRDSLGWYYYEPSSGSNLSILSRYPIVEIYPPRNNAFNSIGVKVNIPEIDQQVNVFNWWLPYWGADYTLLQWSETTTAQDWIDGDNSTAMPVLQSNLSKDVDYYVTDNNPTIIAGDFNSCSHLDFTQAAASAGLHNGWVVDFPVSKKMIEAGYIDSYREANPNEVTHPGGTWAAIYQLCHDFRIDYIYYKSPLGNMVCSHSRTFDENTDIGTQWPSDHAAVLSTFVLSDNSTSNFAVKKSEWNVYPNPCDGMLRIASNCHESKRINLSVFDITGREVLSKYIPRFQEAVMVNLSDKSAGLYVIKIHNIDTNGVEYREVLVL